MSMTLPSDIHRLAQWYSIAAKVGQYLQGRIAQTSEPNPMPKSSLLLLRKFFEYAVDGYLFNFQEERKSATPVMTGISCYDRAVEIMESLQGSTPKSVQVASQCAQHIETVSALLNDGQPDDQSLQNLFNFSLCMMRLGQADAEREFREETDDDD